METNRNAAKGRANFARHGLAFKGAEPARPDTAVLTREDPDGRGQPPFLRANPLARIGAALHAYRSRDVRLISARPATRKEKEAYAQGI